MTAEVVPLTPPARPVRAEKVTAEIPVLAAEGAVDPTPIARGICSACRKPVRLRKNGTIAAHRDCVGGGREPLPVEDCGVCSPLDLPVYAETVHALGHPSLAWDGDEAA